MSEKLNIEQLIRTRLEDAELAPSQDTWKSILRTYRWRQFLRFHPARFNIYYLGAILLVGAGLAMLLLEKRELPGPADIQNESAILSQEKRGIADPVPETVPAEREEVTEPNPPQPSQSSENTKTNEDELTNEPVAEETATAPESDSDGTLEVPIPVETVNPVESVDLIDEQNSRPPMPFAYFTSSVESGCAPLEVTFANQSKNASSYKWTFGTGKESEEQAPKHVFQEPGRYTVTLSVANQEGQTSVSRRLIEVLPKPVAEFKIEEGLEGTDNHVVLNLINYSSSASSYSWCLVDEGGINCSQWSSAEFQPSIELKRITPQSKAVRLEAVSIDGCTDTVRIDLPIKVESSEVKIKFPTAFSPNPSGPGDGSFSPQSKRIDLFHPVYLEVPVEYHMRVFTRRGELVFETQEVYQGWDGYIHQEQAVADVYVWVVEGKWSNGQPFTYRGDVTLIRNQYW